MPNRKKSSKPVERSISDASAKKSKKPSILNIFNKKVDTSSDLTDSTKNPSKRVTRSKSDVSERYNIARKRNNSENEDITNSIIKKKQTAPLSPIIEKPPRGKYIFSDRLNNRNISSTSVTEPSTGSHIVSGNIGFTNQKDLDLVPSKPIADSLKETLTSIVNTNNKSSEDLHSSQQPQEKPPLTKGVTVDSMVKRLSMDRFSPPPHLHGSAFSYTRPNDNKIIYAQVVCDNDGKTKQTVHSSFVNASAAEDYKKPQSSHLQRTDRNGFDTVDSSSSYLGNKKTDFTTSHSTSINSNNNHILYKNIEKHERSISPVQHLLNSDGAKIKKNELYIPRSKNFHSNGRTNSDEDEGLGFDTKRDYEESPIVPVIRDVLSPVRVQLDSSYRGRADGTDEKLHNPEPFPEFNELSERRKLLESRICSRKIGSTDQISHRDRLNRSPIYKRRELRSLSRELLSSPERDLKKSYPKFASRDLLNSYSPDRSDLDLTSSGNIKNSKYIHKTKYYHDGHDGYREEFKRETSIGADGIPHVKEYRSKKRLDSPPSRPREIDLGYIEDNYRHQHLEPDTSYFQEKYRQEFEPKSLDSQLSYLNRSSPEPRISHEFERYKYSPDKIIYKNDNFNLLKREKKQQRSFDKGDSGIENDYRNDGGMAWNSRWRRRTVEDDIRASEMFLKRERQHSEQLHSRRFDYVFRERSIDDGSLFDPRLDKYPIKYHAGDQKSGTLRNEKKIGGLEKVIDIFWYF